MGEIQVVVAHSERATLRVGDMYLKIDTDQARLDVEAEAMAMAPVPTPEILWRRPPVLALAAVPGRPLGRLQEPSTASPAAWAAAGAAVRTLHDSPLPPWPGRSLDDLAARLADECDWLVANDVLPAEVVTRNRRLAETVLRPWTPVFTHGDLQITHVFVDGDQITGIIDWSEASQGDPLYDLATLSLAHEENLDDILGGYGAEVDVDLIRAWWSYRSLIAIRWLAEHGYGSPDDFPEVAVLRSRPWQRAKRWATRPPMEVRISGRGRIEHDRKVSADDPRDWGGYVPTLGTDDVQRIAEWHERAYLEGRREGAAEQVFDYLGTTIVVPPGVQPITRMSHLLGEAVLAETKPGEHVLDMGTGSGVNAILAANRGARVVAVDINRLAVEAAGANARRNGVADAVDLRHSDVFSDVTEDFDLIVFDPPFRWFRPRDLFEQASTDHGYTAMTRFFREARSHLREGGRMLIFFGTSGDLGYLNNLMRSNGFAADVVAHDDLTRDGVTVDYFTFGVA